MVGTNSSGTSAIPNNFGIAINNTTLSIIGNNKSQRNLISGNTTAGIAINGTASCCNKIAGNFIGTDITGLLRLPNDNGILITGANSNIIGGNSAATRNIISGNTTGGITMNGTGTRLNRITGNYIGTDSTGLHICYNQGGVILKSNSNSNIIGDSLPGMGNVLSGNSEIGLYLESSDSNTMMNNLIGPDATGSGPLMQIDSMFQANGIEFNTVSNHNILGGYSAAARNIVSGNRVYGVIYYGQSAYNHTIGNYIGTDVTGTVAMKNATGICVDGASNHSTIANNVLSGNVSYGIFIVTTGTNYNRFTGNMVGTNAAGTDTIPNDIGLLLGGGTKYNVIGGTTASERNIISGNRYEGIEVADVHTSHNQIRGNYIGTDITGNAPLPNKRGIGVVSNPTSNTIAQNVISGNSSFGLLLYNNADSNRIVSNLIGMAANGSTQMGNGGTGIVVGEACSNNLIGLVDSANVIAANDSGGIVVLGNTAINNKISGNSIFGNMYMGIELFPPGPNGNDFGDGDSGPNALMNFPVIATAHFSAPTNKTWVTGTLDTPNPESATIEFFISDNSFSGYGQGKTYLGSAHTGSDGNFSAIIDGVPAGQTITATATDASGNTSEFSANLSVVSGIRNDEESTSGGIEFYPNPVSENGTLSFYLDTESSLNIDVFSSFGSLVFSRDAGRFQAGFNTYSITLSDISKGVYYMIVKTNNETSKFIKLIVQ
jgi:titin